MQSLGSAERSSWENIVLVDMVTRKLWSRNAIMDGMPRIQDDASKTVIIDWQV